MGVIFRSMQLAVSGKQGIQGQSWNATKFRAGAGGGVAMRRAGKGNWERRSSDKREARQGRCGEEPSAESARVWQGLRTDSGGCAGVTVQMWRAGGASAATEVPAMLLAWAAGGQ